MNRVTLIGHLGRDPELRRLENGTAVAKFSVATNETYKDKAGETQTLTEWHEVVIWRGQAEYAEKVLRKGSGVFIDGKLTHRKFTDANGVDKYFTEVVANTFRALEKRDSGRTEASFPTQEPQRGARIAESTPVYGGSGNGHQIEPPITSADDDLPF